ncbi:histidine phosphatase family protein [Sphaerimonospora cavernae]|uniref:Histidine phosphatase family protein n=1 Tax=Sphaerimonospora cavernae TaxID=1740611 RepID=A0ABV6U1S9_9ACTN
MDATEILVARHGEAWCNREQYVGGPRSCRGLTPRGCTQTGMLAERLAAEHASRPIDVVYTTPLPRARETADLVAAALGLAPVVEPDLREPDYGTADGLPWAKVVADFGDAPALHPTRAVAPGAETWAAFLARARAALRQIVTRHEGRRVLIVAHGETIAAAHHLFLGVPDGQVLPLAFVCHPTALSRWQQVPVSWTRPELGRRWALEAHNDIRHLDDCFHVGPRASPAGSSSPRLGREDKEQDRVVKNLGRVASGS